MRLRMTSLGVACNNVARSLTTICGGIETGPVGFSFTGALRRSCGRCAGVPGRLAPAGRVVPGRVGAGCPCPAGRTVPGDALPGRLPGREGTPGLTGRCIVVLPGEAERCWGMLPGCRCTGAWKAVPCGCAGVRWVGVGCAGCAAGAAGVAEATGAERVFKFPVMLRLRVVDGALAADVGGVLTFPAMPWLRAVDGASAVGVDEVIAFPAVLWLRAADVALVLDTVRR